jgi:hypothetical protein
MTLKLPTSTPLPPTLMPQIQFRHKLNDQQRPLDMLHNTKTSGQATSTTTARESLREPANHESSRNLRIEPQTFRLYHVILLLCTLKSLRPSQKHKHTFTLHILHYAINFIINFVYNYMTFCIKNYDNIYHKFYYELMLPKKMNGCSRPLPLTRAEGLHGANGLWPDSYQGPEESESSA